MPKTVPQLWKEKTGLAWSEAKKRGYTKGTYEDNIALQRALSDGNFDLTRPYTVPTIPKYEGNFGKAFNKAYKELGENKMFKWGEGIYLTKPRVRAPITEEEIKAKAVEEGQNIKEEVRQTLPGYDIDTTSGEDAKKRALEDLLHTNLFPPLTAIDTVNRLHSPKPGVREQAARDINRAKATKKRLGRTKPFEYTSTEANWEKFVKQAETYTPSKPKPQPAEEEKLLKIRPIKRIKIDGIDIEPIQEIDSIKTPINTSQGLSAVSGELTYRAAAKKEGNFTSFNERIEPHMLDSRAIPAGLFKPDKV